MIKETARPLEHVLWEVGPYSRDVVTVAEGSGKLEAGTVLGRIDATGQYAPSPHAETQGLEGAQTAVAVLACPVDAHEGHVEAVAHLRITEFKGDELKFHASVDDAAKRGDKQTQLEAAGLIVR